MAAEPGASAAGGAGRADAPGPATGAGAAVDTGKGTPAPAATSSGGGGTVDQLLQNRIRAGGLPLPGQATTVPDAFAIAAVLLPTVPPQPQPQSQPQSPSSALTQAPTSPAIPASAQAPAPASKDPWFTAERGGGPVGGQLSADAGDRSGRAAGDGGFPAGRSDGVQGDGLTAPQGSWAAGDWTGAWRGGLGPVGGIGDGGVVNGVSGVGGMAGIGRRPADGLSATVVSARGTELAVSRDGGRPAVGAARTGAGTDRGSAGSATGDTQQAAGRPSDRASGGSGPLAATGSENAVLIPIAAGLLLTGAAMYKHRGLPRGH